MNAAQIWQAALGELQLEMTQATFNTWLRDTKLIAYEDGDFIIGVRNGYAKEWLENRLASTIRRVLTRMVDRSVQMRFVIWDEPAQESMPTPLLVAAEPAPQPNKLTSTPLNPRYTLDSFIVGTNNRLAHAAAMAVIEHPADSYNPFFVYGGTGLGKTHLLQAIGHACLARNLRVLYVPAETFTNDLVEAIRTYTTESFRETYRTADVLLVDDTQFIAGKEATQEEFFHTFDALHSSGAQIVLSSDRPPRAMATLEKRLQSRFEWGLTVDIHPPDLETRVAILQQKANTKDVSVDTDALYLIAQQVQTNIRELEGVLNKALMLASLENRTLTPRLAEAALKGMAAARPEITGDRILDVVARYYQLNVDEMQSVSRSRRIARPRQIAMFLMRQESDLSLSQIGDVFGGRDHTTVLYACDRVADLSEENDDVRRQLNAIRETLYKQPAVKTST
ncbi:MAG: chromosomal replication initiator protein DnaA [Anaerolineae bacterium]|nr:chromosomal replication initiator protein DnaA [Anaerolineae bacterium]